MLVDVNAPTLWLLKRDPVSDRNILTDIVRSDDDGFSQIRCPLCFWQPKPSNVWRHAQHHTFDGRRSTDS